MFMSLETPIAMAILSRSDQPAVGAAGFLILMAVSIWIESPVIDLLSTSTAFARSRPDFLRVRRFTLAMMVWVTVAHGIVAFTPLYWFLARSALGLPEEVAQAVHLPLRIMLPWSALIGWRRFQQGLLIRSGNTRPIVLGTTLRLATIGLVGFGLFRLAGVPALESTAIALVCSVAVESLFVSWIVQPLVRERYSQTSDAAGVPLGHLLRFHLPLTATTMVSLTVTPLLGSALARMPDSVRSMAAWQVAITLVGIVRIIPFALPETVIALYDERRGLHALAWFSVLLASALTAVLGSAWVLGLDRHLFASILRVPSDLVPLARAGVAASILLPAIGVALGFFRGVLAAEHRSSSRLWAMLLGIAVLVVLLYAVAPRLGVAGVVAAAASLTVSQLIEAAALATASLRRRPLA
jgi:O-antigen/teichoic acid export membrane protein